LPGNRIEAIENLFMNQRRFFELITLLAATFLTACGGEQTTEQNGQTNGSSSRLAVVKQRGTLICGVNGEVPGFSFVNEKGEYSGMDVDLCRAIAAALFDDPSKVEYRRLSTQARFTAVQTGEVDVLNRNTTWTINRDTAIDLEFGPTIFYDSQSIMTTKASGIAQLKDLAGKSVCVLGGTTTEQNLADRMRQVGIENYNPIVSEDVDALYAAYQQGRCEAVTSDRSQLVARRSVLAQPDDHVLLDVALSKEPLGPAVIDGDSDWFDAVKWITYALIQAEEFGITSENISQFQNTSDPNIQRFLGLSENLGEDMGLPNDFAARAIEHVGNYGEIYDRNIGKPFKLERDLNQLWTNGGLLYSPPFR
jgi:general L-amino acid transport system substrate-binding protein